MADATDAEVNDALLKMAQNSLTPGVVETKPDDIPVAKPEVKPETKDSDVPYKDPADIKNFKAQRNALKTMSKELERVRSELDALKKGPGTVAEKKEEQVDILASLDPQVKQWAKEKGLLPILEASSKTSQELRKAQELLNKYQAERDEQDQLSSQAVEFKTSFAEWCDENDVPEGDIEGIAAAIAAGKVGGKTLEDLFANAHEFHQLKTGSVGKGKKAEQDIRAEAERIAAGGSPSSPLPPQGKTRKDLMETYSNLEKSDPRAADALLLDSLRGPVETGINRFRK